MNVSFAHLWQQEALSDADIVLSLPAETSGSSRKRRRDSASDAAGTVLRRMPGHKAILSASPYFSAQVGFHTNDAVTARLECFQIIVQHTLLGCWVRPALLHI
jgi:hypothetical protein